ETATFVEWLKAEGEHVQKGEPLFVIMTDKASIEVESPASGILSGIRARPNEVLPVAQVIGYILQPGESVPVVGEPAHEAATRASVEPVDGAKVRVSQPPLVQTGEAGRVRATPVARRMAAELGVNLAQVPGSGPQGRIHGEDVVRYVRSQAEAGQRQQAEPATRPGAALPQARRRQVVPLAGARRVIASRMVQSAFTAPHIALSLSVDMTEVLNLRDRLMEPIRQRTGQRLSVTAILARVVAAVLPGHPYLNASLEGDNIIVWEDVHLGIATSVEDYLIVPVLREAQNKDLSQIVAELADLVERGRSRRLAPSEMTGSTFTISNLGMFGIESFTAIINPPESAILAVGKIVDTVLNVGGEFVSRPMMNLTLSADHRIVDGVMAARFLADVKA
ncbi:MAG: dihydrolipoamide acetyltransferase family protein, partial [Anaerolineae bacterium]